MESISTLLVFPGLGSSLLATKSLSVSVEGILGTTDTILNIRKNFSFDKFLTEEQRLAVPRHSLLIASPRSEREWETVECIVFLAHPRVVIVDYQGKYPLWLSKYCNPFLETFSFQDVGLPYDKSFNYAVGSRKDLVTKYTFDFPYFKRPKSLSLEGFIDKDGVFLDPDFEKKVSEYNQKSIERKYGFKKIILEPKDVLPSLSGKYCKDKSEVSIKTQCGIRYFKPSELARIMGFPKEYVLPENECFANKLLSEASSPEIMKQIVEEVLPWMP